MEGEGEEEKNCGNCGGSRSNGKPGADDEIVSTVTPPPTPPRSLLPDTAACTDRPSFFFFPPALGLCGQPLICFISVV